MSSCMGSTCSAAGARGARRACAALWLCWWVMLACDGVIAAAVLVMAQGFGWPVRMVLLGLFGPLFNAGGLAFVAWWHTRGPGRRSTRGRSPQGHRAGREDGGPGLDRWRDW
jgi:hypothetical protein